MQGLVTNVVNPGQKRGLLFLHGFLGDEDEFKHIGKHFERTHSVAYAELSGNAVIASEARQSIPKQGSANMDCFTTFAMTGKVTSGAQSKTRWHVVGYSMGGRIALHLARCYPDLISQLTLISASPGLEHAQERRARIIADRALAQRMRRTTMREFLTYWYKQPLFSSFKAHPSFRRLLRRRALQDPMEQAHILETLGTGNLPSLWHEMPKFRVPIHLICGESDLKFCSIANRMLSLNTQIDLTVVAKAGHVVHWESPRAVIERISHVEYRMARSRAF